MPSAIAAVPFGGWWRPASNDGASRRLRSLAVLQIEVSLLRFQFPCPRRRRPGALAQCAAERTRPCRARGAGPARRDDVLWRRYALADGAGDRWRRDRAREAIVGHGG